MIKRTLEQLTKCGTGIADPLAFEFIISSWSFPMWSLTIKEPRVQVNDLEQLREERVLGIEHFEATDAERDPPPAISRSKVEALNDAYATWRNEIDAREAGRIEAEEEGLRTRSLSELIKDTEMPSYRRFEKMFRPLTLDERAALLALAWYAREYSTDWPKNYEHANRMVSTLDDAYQIGLGSYWLDGLNRWAEDSRPFDAGRL